MLQIHLTVKERNDICFKIAGNKEISKLSLILPVELNIPASKPNRYVYDVVDERKLLTTCIKYGMTFSSEQIKKHNHE